MIPSVLASELEQIVKDAISTSFHPTTPGFSGLIERFLANREHLIKGPYVTVSLPFHEGSGRNWFPNIALSFPPYRHQEKAFQRLFPGSPQNTLVATGTGSGKTECFLLPILEHCRQQPYIVYRMLASSPRRTPHRLERILLEDHHLSARQRGQPHQLLREVC